MFFMCVTCELVTTYIFETGQAGFRKLDVLWKNRIPNKKAPLSGSPMGALRCTLQYCLGLHGLSEVLTITLVGVTPDPLGLHYALLCDGIHQSFSVLS